MRNVAALELTYLEKECKHIRKSIRNSTVKGEMETVRCEYVLKTNTY